MRVAVIGVGKLREAWQQSAIAEYQKRLSRFGKLDLIEVSDFPEPERSSAADRAKVMEKEGTLILKQIKDEDYVVALCIRGAQPDSEELSATLTKWIDTGARVVFVIGGSLGLAPTVQARANARLSFSNLTFPHTLMRILLLEQIYRAMKIAANERYHK